MPQGCDDGEDLLEKLAAQEAREKLERAAAKEVKKKEAAWLLAEEDAAWATEEVTTPDNGKQVAGSEETVAATAAATAAKLEPVTKPAPQPKRKPLREIEDKWGAQASAQQKFGEEDGMMESVGPSLAESMAGPAPVKKSPPPQPKKKEKKKWGKIDSNLIGFDADNPN